MKFNQFLMAFNIHKYEISQGGKIYNLSTQIYQRNIIFLCEEINTKHNLIYFTEFQLNEIKQFSSLFNNASNIYEAQNIVDNIIINHKISIENNSNSINIKIFIIKENGIEEYFSFQLFLYNSKKLNMINLQQKTFQNIKNNRNNYYQYSPITRKKFIRLPPRIEIINKNNIKEIKVNKLDKSKIKSTEKLAISLKPKIEIKNLNPRMNKSLSPKRINEPIKVKNKKLEQIKNSTNKIIRLPNKLNKLTQENEDLKLKNLIPLKKYYINEFKEVSFLKEGIRRFLSEINILKKELRELNEYKNIIEKDNNSLKIQLLLKQNYLKNYK